MPRNQKKNTARLRAYQEGKAEVKQFSHRIERAFSRLSEGCSNRVLRATSLGSLRDSNTGGSACLPEVAIYAAGHRGKTKSIYPAR